MDDNADEMFCPSCGERISRTDTFCRFCGAQNTKGEGRSWGPTSGYPPGEPDRSGGEKRRPPTSSHTGDRTESAYTDTGHERTGSPGSDSASTSRGAWSGGPSDTRRGPSHEYGQRQPQLDHIPDDTNQWRRQFPNPDTQKSNRRVVAGAVGLGLLGFILLQVFSLAGLLPAVAAGFSVESTAVLLFATAVGQVFGFVGLALWYLRRRGLSWDGIKSYLGVRKPTLRGVAFIVGGPFLIFAGAIVVGLIATGLSELLEIGDPDEPVGADQEITDQLASTPELIPFAILMMFLIVGPAEEILFRGVVQARMRERISAAPAIVLTSLVFAVIHIPGFAIGASLLDIFTGVAVLTVGSLVFGTVYEYTENIVVVALLHGLYNSLILLLVYAISVYDLDEMTTSVLGSVPL